MSSGDVGRFDDDGRLYVEGRDDEMIVSGGENVFPQEVEDCLARHEAVVEVAAIGVDDDRVRQAAAGVRRRRAEPAADRGRAQGLGEAEPRPLQGAARDRVPRRAAPQRDRQDAQARARSNTTDAPAPGPRRSGPALERHPGARLHPARPVRPGRRRCRRTRPQGGRCSCSTPGRSPACAPARWPASATGSRVHDLRHRGARDLLRPDVLPARRSPTPTGSTSRCSRDFWPHGEVAQAYGVFDASEGCARRSSFVVDREGDRALGGAQRSCPTGRDLDEHLAQLHHLA